VAGSQDAATVSVVICAYTSERWENLRAAVASVANQTRPPLETIVVIDHNDELRDRAEQELQDVVLVTNAHAPGLSGGRRTGAGLARGEVVAFLDDDAVAEREWLDLLVAGYADPLVLGVGGAVDPAWEQAPPGWLAPEFNWVVGCTYRGMPVDGNRIRNPIGANMSVRASVFASVGEFDARLGRGSSGGRLSGAAEETEFCIRASREHPGHYWIFEPRARVLHSVPAERLTWRYYRQRCVEEGRAKALLADIAGSGEGLTSERAYVRSVLPRAVLRELRAPAGRRWQGVVQASAIIAGLSITAGAYLSTRFARTTRRSR
jgi:glycosyltransferase involved in cell wall biosynthesis